MLVSKRKDRQIDIAQKKTTRSNLRALVIGLAPVLLGFPVLSFAMGLGNITVYSTLDQIFNAQIPVVEVGPAPLDSIHVKLASPEQFQVAGISRTAALQNLQFTILRANNGQAYIQVSSSQPISEPALTFLLNLSWANGALAREYTVFLDPQGYTHQAAAPLQPAGSASGANTAVASTRVGQTYGPTTTTDNLWQIAKKVRPSPEVSIQQTMSALVQKNPQAFTNGDINGLKAGYQLAVPTLDEIKQTATTTSTNSSADASETETAIETPNIQPDFSDDSASSDLHPLTLSEDNPPNVETEKASNLSQAVNNEAENTSTSQADTALLQSRVVELQKQLMEKDREILILENLLEEQQKSIVIQAKPTPQTTPNKGNVTHSGAIAGAIPTPPSMPWYLLPLLLTAMLASIVGGAVVQKRRMINRGAEPLAKKSVAQVSDDIQEMEVSPSFQPMESPTSVSIQRTESPVNQLLAIEAQLKQYHDSGESFESGIKLLESYGDLNLEKEFNYYYRKLQERANTGTQKALLQAMVTHFPHLLKTPAESQNTDFTSQTSSTESPLVQTLAEETSGPAEPTVPDTPLEFEYGLGKSYDLAPPATQTVQASETVWEDMFKELSLTPQAEQASPEETLPQEPESNPGAAPDFEVQLELAKAYFEMGDVQEAKEIIEMILQEGNETQKQQARALLEKFS